MSNQPKHDSSTSDPLHAEVRDRFGVLPNFFRLAPEAPGITENLWGFAKFGYLDNPLPPLFKERLFVYLSRFCEVRYCIARHVGFLAGLGRPSGDRQSQPETVEQVVRLIRRELPRGDDLEPHLSQLEAFSSPLAAMPDSDTQTEEAIFACATHVFLQTPQASRCLEALRRVFDAAMFQHLLVFLSFVRTAHFWTKLHPELQLEEDITNLLTVHEALAECVVNDPEAAACETTQSLMSELDELRRERSLSEAMRQSEKRFRSLVTATAQMVWTTDPQGRVIGDSPTWREFTGQSYDEWKGEGWLDAVHPDDRGRAISAWKQAVEEKVIYTVDYRLRRQDGAYRWTTARGVPVLEEDGGIREWIGTNTDITERRRAEEERERFFAVGADLLVVVGYDGYFKEVGPSCERTLGWTAAELKSEPWIDFLHPDDRAATLDVDRQVTQGREVLSFENRYRHKDGSYRWLDWKAKPYPQESLIFAGASDVTDRKSAEDRLRQIADELQTVLEAVPAVVWIAQDPECRLITGNRAASDLLRLPHEANQSVSAPDGEKPVHFKVMRDGVELRPDQLPVQMAATGVEVRDFEEEVVFEDGKSVHLLGHAMPLRDETGQVRGSVASFVDITERKLAEEAIHLSEMRYRLVGQAANDAIWDWDLVTNQVTWSEGVRRVFRYALDQIGPDATWWYETIHPDDRERVVHGIHAAIDGDKEYWQDEYRFRRADGSYAEVYDRGRVVREGGKATRMVGSMLDVTERKRAEEALRQSETQYRLIVEGNPALICRFKPDGTLTYVNDTYCRTFGKSREELIGHRFTPLIPAEDQPAIARTLSQLAPDMAPHTDEHRVTVAGGTVRWHRWTNIPIVDDEGKFYEYQAIGIDITERKQAEEALREADRRKDEFLATLAHELRNPLAPIRNGLQVLRLGGATGDMADQARTMMERQLSQMVHLIDDLLDLSRISRGKIELRKERVELAKVVQQAVETSRPAIEEAGHDFLIDLPPGPIYVDADVTRLAQVFSNLLNNAAKYTERGGRVRLTVKRHGTEAVVSVRDTGIGIPAHMLPHVFEMFTQVDRNLERSQGGLGIGLSIVRRLVDMHGGSVEAKSDGHGMGSEFIVRLPVVLSVMQPRSDEVEPVPSSSRRRVLVVDDNRDAAVSLAMMLKLMGNEAKTAHDGLEALDVAAAYRPDLILLDIGMPKMNGYDTARHIRQQPWGKGVVLVALTGWGQDEDRRKSQDAGFDSHMTKPIEPAALEKLLANLKAETA